MRKLLFVCFILFWAAPLLAQNRQVTGTVTSSAGTPLQGVTVKVGNTNTLTDSVGRFTIQAAKGQVVQFSHSGMKAFSQTITGSENALTVQLQDDPQNLEEVVVVGYMTERKRDLKGAVAVVKMDDALKENKANLMASLQGRVPGLVISTDGAPGTGVNINLRGLASFNNNTPPLFVIDGVPTYDFNGLNPNDIESLQVLKDAASAAIYGARASSGVIVVTTKKGKSRNTQVTVDAFYGVKTRRNKLDMLNAQEFGQVLWQGFKNDGVVPSDPIYGSGPEPVIPAFLDAAKTTPSGNTDWQKEVFQPA